MLKAKKLATVFAILAAALYALNIPISKLLLQNVGATMMAAFLYLGAGIGMLLYHFFTSAVGKTSNKEPLTKKELPYTVAMVVLDVAAPILLMAGISRTTSANVSLLNNFEIVATSLVALLIFGEVISKRLWFAILLVTAASMILSFEGTGAFVFNEGSLLVLGACLCWGVENNCTKMISHKSSEEIVVIKGCFSGLASFLIALVLGEKVPDLSLIAAILLLGFVSYGLSINFYIMAQKDLGAAKTSAYYSIAPFLGVAFSTVILTKDTVELQHNHEHEHIHCHAHAHGNLIHTHEHIHRHSHLHIHEDGTDSHLHSHVDLQDHNHPHPTGI